MKETHFNLSDILTPLILLLMPLFFLTTTVNFFSTNKQALLIFSALLSLLVYGYYTFKNKTIRHASTNLNLPLIILSAVLMLNLIINTEARTEGILNRGSLILSLVVLTYITTLSSKPKALIKRSLQAIVLSSSILAILSLLQLLFISNLTSVPVWMQNKVFTPTGSPIVSAMVLVVGLAISLSWALKTKDGTNKTMLFISSGLVAAALVAYVSLMLPGQELNPELLPHRASWSITLDSFKNPRSTFVGVGLANFPAIYTITKPLFINGTDLWSIVPQTASNEIFQILITMGLLGLASFLFLVFATFKNISKLTNTSTNFTLRITFYTLLVMSLLLPFNSITYTILFLSMALIAIAPMRSSAISPRPNILSTYNLHPNVAITTTVVIAVLVAYVGYMTGRVYAAEYHIKKAQDALVEGNGGLVYEEHIKAIENFPTISSYRVSYSQVNLSIASSLSAQENLSDEDRNSIAQLVQQSIREARAATTLRPSLYSTWQNLASIYRNLINVAEGAEQFAIDNYAQAVALAPANAPLRLDYGGLFYQLAQQSEDENEKVQLINAAAQQFQTAIQLRPNYANAYYNLAKVYELAGNNQLAFQAMQTVVGLIDPTTSDYQTAVAELEALRAKLPAQETTEEDAQAPQTGEITEPEPLPSPIEGGPIVLPEDDEPTPSPELPIPSSSPQPTPTPTPTPTPEL